MASKIMKQIEDCIDNSKNFLLSGGAGSGKTHTLMEVLDYIYETNPYARVACITYTNVAVEEIKNRTSYENLWVSTIHEFLWSSIKNYQKNLKESIVELVSIGKKDVSNGLRYNGEDELNIKSYLNIDIQYRDFRKLEEGVISHDDVLTISNYMFNKYELLNRLIIDKYDYILIDEYQDTEKQVIQIFLEYMQNTPYRKNIIGFFGDSMQSIYDKRMGNLNKYIELGLVREIIKEDNWRCSISVTNLINKIRDDKIVQEPVGENKNIEGDIKFIYSTKTKMDLTDIKKHNIFNSWDFSDIDNTKELYLTRKLIAMEMKFIDLFNIYNKERKVDRLIGDDKDRLIKHLFKIEEIIDCYKNRKYNEFIKKTDFKIKEISDKSELKRKINLLVAEENKSIEEIIQLAHIEKLVVKDDDLEDFIANNDLYEAIKKIPYKQFKKVYEYDKGYSPYSTQHGIKGAEFNNVFIVLDNGGWNNYNFGYLFRGVENKETVVERTKKIFYVCCSRAMHNLVVYFHNPCDIVISRANEWFGKENVISIDV